MPSNHLILCHLLLPPLIFPSIRVFPNESVLCIRYPKYWSFGISPSNEYSGLVSFSIVWLDLLAVQGTLKSLLQWMYLLNTWIFVQLLSGVWLFATHGLQHARLPCPSPSPWVYSNSCPLSQWCHPTISSYVIPFSSCLQSFPASGSFLRSQLFTSGGQSIGVSASTSVLPMNIQD